MMGNKQNQPQKAPLFLKFDQIKSKWNPFTQKQEADTNNITKFSCLTYNVWFEPHNFNERSLEIMQIVEQNNPDFVCFQEVTKPFLEVVKQNLFIQKNFFLSNNFIQGYGVMILQKFQPLEFYEVSFPTMMGRSLIGSITKINGKDIYISTSHLESLNNDKIRQTQLTECYKFFGQAFNVIMMGDFNFDSPDENKRNIEELSGQKYLDVWKELRPNDIGHTMKKTVFFNAWRPDRVIYHKQQKKKMLIIQKILNETNFNIYYWRLTYKIL